MFNSMSHNPYYAQYDWSMQHRQMQHSFNTAIATSLQGNSNGLGGDSLNSLPVNDSILNSLSTSAGNMHQQIPSTTKNSMNSNDSKNMIKPDGSPHRHPKSKQQNSNASPSSNTATSEMNNSTKSSSQNNSTDTNSQLNKSLNSFNYGAAGVTPNNVDMLRLSTGFDMSTAADLYNPAANILGGAVAAASQSWQYGYPQYSFTSAYPTNNMIDMTHFSGKFVSVF